MALTREGTRDELRGECRQSQRTRGGLGVTRPRLDSLDVVRDAS